VRGEALQLAVAFDSPDHRGVESEPAVEQEAPPARVANTDALHHAPAQGERDGLRRSHDVGGRSERLRVYVRRTAGQRTERAGGANQSVGGFVEGAVAAENQDRVEAIVGRRASEFRGVTAPRGLGDLHVVVRGERLLHEHAFAGRDRRRGRVHE
jgi:hypothetical protein